MCPGHKVQGRQTSRNGVYIQSPRLWTTKGCLRQFFPRFCLVILMPVCFQGLCLEIFFCSFAWAIFFFFLRICYLKLGVKKISHLSQSLQTGRQHLHQLAGQVLSLEISLAWKFEVFSGLFWTCVFPGLVYCSISVTAFKCLHFLEYNPCFFLDLLCFIMLPNQ